MVHTPAPLDEEQLPAYTISVPLLAMLGVNETLPPARNGSSEDSTSSDRSDDWMVVEIFKAKSETESPDGEKI